MDDSATTSTEMKMGKYMDEIQINGDMCVFVMIQQMCVIFHKSQLNTEMGWLQDLVEFRIIVAQYSGKSNLLYLYRIILLDSDGESPLLTRSYRYYAALNKTIRYIDRDEIWCHKHGAVLEPDRSCSVATNFYPPWGSPRNLITSGSNFSIDYFGVPLNDYLEIQITPGKFNFTSELSTSPTGT